MSAVDLGPPDRSSLLCEQVNTTSWVRIARRVDFPVGETEYSVFVLTEGCGAILCALRRCRGLSVGRVAGPRRNLTFSKKSKVIGEARLAETRVELPFPVLLLGTGRLSCGKVYCTPVLYSTVGCARSQPASSRKHAGCRVGRVNVHSQKSSQTFCQIKQHGQTHDGEPLVAIHFVITSHTLLIHCRTLRGRPVRSPSQQTVSCLLPRCMLASKLLGKPPSELLAQLPALAANCPVCMPN